MKEVTRGSIRIRERAAGTYGCRPVVVTNLADEWDTELRLTPQQLRDLVEAGREILKGDVRLHRPDRTEATGT